MKSTRARGPVQNQYSNRGDVLMFNKDTKC
jgi:hypothetical protein